MKALALIGWLLTGLAAADEQQPMLIQASTPICFTDPYRPRLHGHYEKIDPAGDERAVA